MASLIPKRHNQPTGKPVSDELCDARMERLETKLNYLFGTTLISIALLIINILKH